MIDLIVCFDLLLLISHLLSTNIAKNFSHSSCVYSFVHSYSLFIHIFIYFDLFIGLFINLELLVVLSFWIYCLTVYKYSKINYWKLEIKVFEFCLQRSVYWLEFHWIKHFVLLIQSVIWRILWLLVINRQFILPKKATLCWCKEKHLLWSNKLLKHDELMVKFWWNLSWNTSSLWNVGHLNDGIKAWSWFNANGRRRLHWNRNTKLPRWSHWSSILR